ncbi:hypothetical protein I2W78_24205 [Streptomyces spinoverrucosus]|uniref:hypothetical protein n=1 Tax=Streptomyces spinoverrucosus TaxID=284043 RepID=UPI0018C3DABE|nr:hypothetical protein [Streptomyces spinoverrucosus]MBG0854860.1 hypothetical protein [Streptomyces spinoverrucosus]
MSKRQVREMLRLMAAGGPVELTSPMASVKKLARLAFFAQQFGYEYADARQAGRRNNMLVMLIMPDPSPVGRARAAQNWAQYPKAGDGVSLPPVVPDALELLKARITFDLTGRHSEKQRLAYAALAVSVGSLVVGLKIGGDSAFLVAGLMWGTCLSLLAVAFTMGRRRNAKYAARLQAAGFTPVTDENGRLRYLPPGARTPGNPYASGPYGEPAPGAHVPPPAPGPHVPPPAPGPYAPQQPPSPQQNPHWQPPQH